MSELNEKNLNLTETQAKVQNYFERHNLEEILSDMLNTLAHSPEEKPLIFMIKYLGNLCKKEELEAAGIKMVLNSNPSFHVTSIIYPNFDLSCQNLFKQMLTKEVFLAAKNRKTPTNHLSLRPILQGGLENQNHRIGCFAPDAESYETFDNLFNPMIEQLNAGIPALRSFAYRKDLSSNLTESRLDRELSSYLLNFSMRVRRNIKDHPFNLVLTTEERESINGKIISVLRYSDEFPTFYNLGDLNEEGLLLLKKSLGNLFKEKENFRRQGLRFKDWPQGRVLTFSNDKKILIWLNKEDHFELNLNVKEPVMIRESIQRVLNLITVLDKQLNFQFNGTLGYISSNPGYTGLGIKFLILLRIPSNIHSIFKQNLENFFVNSKSYVHFQIREQDVDGSLWEIVFKKRAGVNQSELITLVETTLKQLLENIVEGAEGEDQEEIFEEVVRPVDVLEERKPATNIKMQEEPAHGLSKRTSTGYTIERIKATHSVDEECYTIFAQEIKEKFLKSEKLIHDRTFDLSEIIEKIKIEFLPTTHTTIQNHFLIGRRNVQGFPFRPAMSKSEFEEINQLFVQFIKEVPIRFGEFLTASDSDFKEVVERLVEDFNLQKDSEKYKIEHGLIKEKDRSHYPWGSSVYYTKNRNFAVIANFDDHFTLLYKISNYNLKDALLEIDKIFQVLQKFVRKFSYLNEFGFLTPNPKYSGSGLSISCRFKEGSRNESAMEIEKEEQHQSVGLNLLLENDGHIRLDMHRLNPNKCDAYLEFLHMLIKRQKTEKLQKLIKEGQLLGYGEGDAIGSYEGIVTVHSLNCLDCFDEDDFGLVAPSIECYSAFGNLYYDYFKVKYVSNVPVHQLRGADMKGLLVFNKSKDQNNEHKLKIKFEIGRNVQNFDFNKFLRNSECNKLKQTVVELLNVLGEVHQILDLEDVDSNLPKGLFPIDYSPAVSNVIGTDPQVIVPSHKRYAIWLFKEDHIRLVSTVDGTNIENVMKHMLILLENFEKNKINFSFDEKFGYLSERAINLGFNMKVALSFKANPELEGKISENIRNYGYSLTTEDIGPNEKAVLFTLKSKRVSDFFKDIECVNYIFENME